MERFITQIYPVATSLLASISKYEDGKLVKNATVRPKDTSNPRGRVEGCTDWYLVTYSGNTVISEEYLFTTCDGGDCQQTRQSAETPVLYSCPGTGGGGNNPSNPPSYNAATTPGSRFSQVFEDPCQFTQTIWNNGANSNPPMEWQGVIASDGSLIILGSSGVNRGQFNGLYQYNDGSGGPDAVKTYYYYPADGNMPPFGGTSLHSIAGNDYYFIPIKATVHTHTPCLQDDSDGITHNVGDDDRNLATKFDSIRHYVIGCVDDGNGGDYGNVTAQYSGSSTSFFNRSNCTTLPGF